MRTVALERRACSNDPEWCSPPNASGSGLGSSSTCRQACHPQSLTRSTSWPRPGPHRSRSRRQGADDKPPARWARPPDAAFIARSMPRTFPTVPLCLLLRFLDEVAARGDRPPRNPSPRRDYGDLYTRLHEETAAETAVCGPRPCRPTPLFEERTTPSTSASPKELPPVRIRACVGRTAHPSEAVRLAVPGRSPARPRRRWLPPAFEENSVRLEPVPFCCVTTSTPARRRDYPARGGKVRTFRSSGHSTLRSADCLGCPWPGSRARAVLDPRAWGRTGRRQSL